MDTLLFLFSDCVWLPLLEMGILILFLISITHDISIRLRKSSIVKKIERGGESWGILFTFWGLSIIFVEIIISSDLITNYRTIVGLLNVAILIYLSIISAYFKNKIIGWDIKLRKWSQQI